MGTRGRPARGHNAQLTAYGRPHHCASEIGDPITTEHIATGHAHISGELGLSVLRRPTHTIARLRGDLDAATAPALRERLAAILHPRTRLLVLDLSEIWFCDAAGLAVLIGTQRRATLLGTALRLAAPRAQVAKVLHATGLDRSLAIHPTLAGALTPALTPHDGTARLRHRSATHPAQQANGPSFRGCR
jgi:anti-anti-sigma factor